MSLVSGLLNQSIDIYSTTKDSHNTITKTVIYADVSCRWQEKITTIIGADSKEKTSRVTVWILPEYTVLNTYEAVKDGEVYKIIGIQAMYDLGGMKDHIVLFLT